jgi:FlaA1/EpsC-like NDP-sugar epimerase
MMPDNGKFLRGKRVLVTGAFGTVGAELVHQLLEEDYGPAEIVAKARMNLKHFMLKVKKHNLTG